MLVGLIGRNRLVCVNALAGSGKTTAVRQATARMGRPLAWLELDMSEAAPGRLLTYLDGAVSQVVESVAGTAISALAARVPQEEVAALLAESVGESAITIVIDNAERLISSPEALRVLQAFARFLPAGNRLVIISRTPLPFERAVIGLPWVAALGERDLTFTVAEAAAALERTGRRGIDPVEAVTLTGGWVTGVLFEAWRSSDHVMGLGGDADPLHGYLATEILGELPEAQRDLMIATSILPELTAESLTALNIPDGPRRLLGLRSRRLPGVWTADGSAFSCHPRFREYLLKLLSEWDSGRRQDLHNAYARLLLAHGHDEEAVEELLAGECFDEALAVAPGALRAVLERGDFQVAERWIQTLNAARGEREKSLVTAELLLAVAEEDFSRGVEIADAVRRSGEREAVTADSGLAAGLMAWCYLHAGRVRDMEEVLDGGAPGTDVTAARYALCIVHAEPGPTDTPVGELTGSPLDALVMRVHFDVGRIPLLGTSLKSQWATRVAESWIAASLFVKGDVDRAFELYHGLVNAPHQSVWLTALLGPQLLAAVGEAEAAIRQLKDGRARIIETGSEMFYAYSVVLEADFEILLRHNPAGALDILAALEQLPVGQTYALVAEQRRSLTGLALLELGCDEPALEHLSAAAAGMSAGRRLLHLPKVGVYLAEACWRNGDEAGADRAADLALAAADRQGTNHFLLEALEHFPDVLARRLDMESSADTAWHEIGRSLMVRGVRVAGASTAAVYLTEFGKLSVLLNGSDVDPRLMKSLELLALLAANEGHAFTRGQLLDCLFEGRKDESSASYARQAVFRLRKAIPDLVEVDGVQGTVRLTRKMQITAESNRVLSLIAQAAAMRGEDKLKLLLDALEIAERGEYLPGIRSAWAEDRRGRLAQGAATARFEAASTAFSLGRYRIAERLSDAVLRDDPYHEGAWRVRMRVAHALGDSDAVLKAYRACALSLSELGIRPSRATSALLTDLRSD